LEIDAGATLQLEGSDAVDAPAITGETNAGTINLPGKYTIKTAWHFSDDGRSGKSVKDLSVSATAEDTSSQSTSADNGFVVSSPFAATLSGNGDSSAPALLSTPSLALPQQSAAPYIPPPINNPSGQSVFPFKPNLDHHAMALSSDLSREHSAHPSKPNSDHQASADPEIKDIAKDQPLQHPADNLPHGPVQHADNGSPAVTEGAHPAHPHFDGNHPANPKFADDGSAHPGKVPHDPPTALSSDLSGDSAQPFKPNSDHHASAGPGINDIAKDQHPADNLPHGPAQHADNGSPTVTDGAHPAHPHFDANQPDSFKFADNDSTDPEIKDIAKDHPLQHPADNLAHGPAQLAYNGSPTDDSFKFADNGSTHPGTIKPDTIEIDPITAAEIKHLLDTPDADAVSALDPTHAPAPQDMTKVQVPYQGDFHFA
jgi:hypothetical protein